MTVLKPFFQDRNRGSAASQSPPTARGPAPAHQQQQQHNSGGTSQPPSVNGNFAMKDDHEHRLHEEIVFLQRKVKYLHSVSTIFRQKVALIMREVGRNPNNFPEQQKLYTLALSELTRAEADAEDPFAVGERVPMIGEFGMLTGGSAHGGGAAGGTTSTTQKGREDIQKAHQLCLVLQEKNDLKQKEIELRAELAKQKESYSDLYERHQRLIELQLVTAGGGGSGGGDNRDKLQQVHAEIFREREDTLQRQLDAAHQELLQLRASIATGGLSTNSNHAVGSGEVTGIDAHTSAMKQNALLKGRVTKLKEELAASLEQNSINANRMQADVEKLVQQLNVCKQEMDARDRLVRVLRNEKNDIAKELIGQRTQQEFLEQKVSALEKQLGVTVNQPNGHAGAAKQQQQNAESAAVADFEMEEMRVTMLSMSTTIARLEEDLAAANEAVLKERTSNVQKDGEISALGAQLRAFRSRMEAVESDAAQRDMQMGMMQDVETRVLDAVKRIQHASSTEGLIQQVTQIQSQMGRLEGVEMQLRQKEDEMALLQDELLHTQEQHRTLKDSLMAISSLLLHFPKSVDSLERLVIELNECKRELQRCAIAKELPDLNHVAGLVELRCLEAETERRRSRAKKQQENGGGWGDRTASEDATALMPPSVAAALASLGNNNTPDDRTIAAMGRRAMERQGRAASQDTPRGGDVMGIDAQDAGAESYDGEGAGGYYPSVTAVPPVPPLIDITEAMAMVPDEFTPPQATGGGRGSAAVGSTSSHAAVTEDDIRLTFQLFDERGSGVLPMEAVRLCLTTLGLPLGLLASSGRASATSMTAGEFLAMCLKATMGHM